MKKQMLTKQDIQRELWVELSKRKTLAICLTAFLFVSIICYVLYIVAYINGVDLQPLKSSATLSSLLEFWREGQTRWRYYSTKTPENQGVLRK